MKRQAFTRAILLLSLSFALFCSGLRLDAAQAPSSPLQTGRKSSFEASKGTRNIMWPIAWSPTAPAPKKAAAAAPQPVVQNIRPEQFNVSTILLGAERLAVINGKEFAEGDSIQVPGGPSAKLVSVRDGSVVLQVAGQDPVVVAIKQK